MLMMPPEAQVTKENCGQGSKVTEGENNEDLLNDLRRVSQRRREYWELTFNRFCMVSALDETSHSVEEITDDAPLFSNRVKRDDLTPDEKRLVEQVEDDLKSNLKELILHREKMKLTFNKNYRTVHLKTKAEIKRLRRVLSSSDVEKYISLCLILNENKIAFIEETGSSLKENLLGLFEAVSRKFDHRIWKRAVLQDWSSLSSFLTEEDIVLYAIKVMTKKC